MTASPTDVRWKILQDLEAWIERATGEVTDLDDQECSYEYERACAWLGTLEDRRTRLLQQLGLDDVERE